MWRISLLRILFRGMLPVMHRKVLISVILSRHSVIIVSSCLKRTASLTSTRSALFLLDGLIAICKNIYRFASYQQYRAERSPSEIHSHLGHVPRYAGYNMTLSPCLRSIRAALVRLSSYIRGSGTFITASQRRPIPRFSTLRLSDIPRASPSPPHRA